MVYHPWYNASIKFIPGATFTNIKIEEERMHFRYDQERDAWADYVRENMTIAHDESAGERRAQMVKVCEEADWLIEEMRRRA